MWNRSFETTNSNNKQKKNHIDNVWNPVNITIYCQPKYEYISQILKKAHTFWTIAKNTYNQQAKKIKPNKMYDLSHFISVLSIVRHLFRPNKYFANFWALKLYDGYVLLHSEKISNYEKLIYSKESHAISCMYICDHFHF